MKWLIILACFYGTAVFAQSAENTQIAQIIQPTEPPHTATVPENCGKEGFGVQDKQLMFNSDKATPRIFILHNTSQGTVVLSHLKSIPGAGVQQSKLDQGNWAVVSVSDSNFSMGCLFYKPPNIGYVDCLSVISVCSIPTEVSLGSFWLAENGSLDHVLNKAKGRGAPV